MDVEKFIEFLKKNEGKSISGLNGKTKFTYKFILEDRMEYVQYFPITTGTVNKHNKNYLSLIRKIFEHYKFVRSFKMAAYKIDGKILTSKSYSVALVKYFIETQVMV